MLKKIICILFLLPHMALASAIIEGKDFQTLSGQKMVDSSQKGPVVTEFFSYGCPWCFKIEAPIHQWLHRLGTPVQLIKVPVVFKPEWDLYAKAYYTANTLALADKLNPLLFKAIQEEKTPLTSKQAMIAFFVAHGVDKEIASSAFEHSPTIDMRVSNGTALMASYQINAVPAFVVNNKYKTDLQMAGSPERLLQILDYLLGKST
ncbi:MAG: thiol:disulfide interchange protein DsbA/DsbL [Legionellales bacterium]